MDIEEAYADKTIFAPTIKNSDGEYVAVVPAKEYMEVVSAFVDRVDELKRCGNCEHIRVPAMRCSNGLWGTCAECSKKMQDKIKLFTPACRAWELITIKEIVEPKEEEVEEPPVEVTTTYFNDDEPPYVVMSKLINPKL